MCGSVPRRSAVQVTSSNSSQGGRKTGVLAPCLNANWTKTNSKFDSGLFSFVLLEISRDILKAPLAAAKLTAESRQTRPIPAILKPCLCHASPAKISVTRQTKKLGAWNGPPEKPDRIWIFCPGRSGQRYRVRGVSLIKFTYFDSCLVFFDFDILSLIKEKKNFGLSVIFWFSR